MKPELVIPLLSSAFAVATLMVYNRRAQRIALLLELHSETFNACKDMGRVQKICRTSQQLNALWLARIITMGSLLMGVAGIYSWFTHHLRTALLDGFLAAILLAAAMGIAIAELALASKNLPAERHE